MTNDLTDRTVLVIEDTAEFAQVAQNAIYRLSGWNPVVVSSHEEAMRYLQYDPADVQSIEKIDAVISDLFFPSETDWRDELLLKLTQSGKGDRSNGMPTENPSGLAIAKWCHEHQLPFVLVSQGDRHGGNLGLVREHMLGKVFIDDRWDPLPDLLVRRGGEVDKREPCVWVEAMFRLLQDGAG